VVKRGVGRKEHRSAFTWARRSPSEGTTQRGRLPIGGKGCENSRKKKKRARGGGRDVHIFTSEDPSARSPKLAKRQGLRERGGARKV